ncbi:MAG TPA: DUF72 domain-containing protein [Thermoanaerobaculia bacterium]|nr:DUF72 domain-containing protein [Thermoanaerobaculia bacterium]
MTTVKTGLCGFTIGAAAYFETFPVVEVQQTFYDPPSARTLERWRMQAPPAFEFTMKAWQVITHASTSRTYRRMKTAIDIKEAGGFRVNETVLRAWDTTRTAARILRATAILFQCPASFRPTDENVANMRAFFNTIERPKRVRLLWEPRGDWPDEIVLTLCRDLGLVHAVDPFIRPSLTPELTYWRLHGNGSAYATYIDDELRQLRDWITGDTYAMFNNIPRVGDAKRFLASA